MTRLVQGACLLFAAVLLASALLKTHAPGWALQALGAAGCRGQLCEPALLLLAALEATAAFTVIAWRRLRAGAWVVAGTASLLVISQFVVSAAQPCGCFGDLMVPRAAVLTYLITTAGLASLGVLRGSFDAVRPAWSHVWPVAAGACWTAFGWATRPDEVTSRIALAHLLSHMRQESAIIIGGWGCPHCRTIAERNARERSAVDTVMVCRASDDAHAHGVVQTLHVPDAMWWVLAQAGPPRLLVYRNGAVTPY